MNSPFIYYWRFENGEPEPRQVGNVVFDNSLPRGYYGWAYVDRCPPDFEQWCIDNLKGENEIILRFNSGSPIYTLFIADDDDAMLFKLKYSDYIKAEQT